MKVADFLGRYKPAETTVRVLMDGSLAAELERARQEVKQAQRRENLNPQGLATKVPVAEQRVDELEARADELTSEVLLRAIPGEKFTELKLAHPPTEEQWNEYRQQAQAMPLFANPPDCDPLGMAPGLIALSVVAVDGDPVEWTVQDGQELWDALPDGPRADLLDAAWRVNAQRSSRPFSGTGTDTTPSSGPESTTQQNGESPSLSSAEGS